MEDFGISMEIKSGIPFSISNIGSESNNSDSLFGVENRSMMHGSSYSSDVIHDETTKLITNSNDSIFSMNLLSRTSNINYVNHDINNVPTTIRRTSSLFNTPAGLANFPKRIILVRHGQSLGNVDESAYATIPDWKIPLTSHGRNQALQAGKSIRNLIGNEPISVFCSPYLRTRQTLGQVMTQLTDNYLVSAREEPRLTEQQFGNFQKTEDMQRYKKERHEYGRFYYRFPQGESGLDVYNRVSLFHGTLFREWEKQASNQHDGYHVRDTNVIIITHGLTLRLFLTRWFQFSVREFEKSDNPDNGSIIVMHRNDIINTNQMSQFADYLACNNKRKQTFLLDDDTFRKLNMKSTVIARAEMFEKVSRKRVRSRANSVCDVDEKGDELNHDNFNIRKTFHFIQNNRLDNSMETDTTKFLTSSDYAALDLELILEES
eukprot:gene4423-6252_t